MPACAVTGPTGCLMRGSAGGGRAVMRCSLMSWLRTGLRLAEQASLTVLEVPCGGSEQAYQRFWLPAAVAKNGSARWVYLPAALARKIGEYCAADRAEIIAGARSRGAYGGVRGPLVIESTRPHPGAVLRLPGGG